MLPAYLYRSLSLLYAVPRGWMHVDDWLSQPPNLTRSCWHCRTKHHWHGGQYQRLSIHCNVLKEAQHPWGWRDSIQQQVCSVGRCRSRAHLLRPASALSVSPPTTPASLSKVRASPPCLCLRFFSLFVLFSNAHQHMIAHLCSPPPPTPPPSPVSCLLLSI